MTPKNRLSVLISGNPQNELARKTAEKAIKTLEMLNVNVIIHKNFLRTKESASLEKARPDFAIVFGGDGTLLHFLREAGKKQIPVLGVNCGAAGKLMQVHHNRVQHTLENISSKRFETEKRARMESTVDGKEMPIALNDVMLAPKKPAVLMRYDLFIDNEFFFRDMADAVLFSTVTGSTAYSLSTANPIAHKKSRVMLVRPVNSIWHPQPIIVDENSEIRIENIDCQIETEAIIDCQERHPAKKEIVIKKSKYPALIVKVKKEPVDEKEHLKNAMPSAKYIFWLLKQKGSMTQSEIIRETGLSFRTTKRALDYLVRHEILSKQPLFTDKKKKLYSIK